MTASTYLVRVIELLFIGKVNHRSFDTDVRVIGPEVRLSFILAGDIGAIGLDQRRTAIGFQDKGRILSTDTETPEPCASPLVRERVFIPRWTIRTYGAVDNLDISDEALIPLADNLVSEIKVVTQQMLLDRVVGLCD